MASPMETGGNPTEKLMIEPSDHKISEKVQQIHSPDDREIDTQLILRIIEDILHSATPVGMQGAMPEKTIPADADTSMLDALSYVVNEIYFEMTHEFLSNGDEHATTLSLLEILSNYSWDAKLVLLLAAFVLYYAEFWFPVKNQSSSKLAQKMDFLRKVPETDVLKERLGVLTDLIMAILDLVQFIILFRKLPPETLGKVPAFSAFSNAVPIAVYRAIRGVLICVAYIAHLPAIDNEHSPSSAQGGEKNVSTSKTDKIEIAHFRHTPSSAEDWNGRVSTLTDNIRKTNEHLQEQLTSCENYLEDKRQNDAYDKLVGTFESDGGTLDKFLNALLIVKENELPLFDGKQKVNFDCLKNRIVFFLISGLHDDSMELDALSLTYNKFKEIYSDTDLEIVWIPILEGGSETKDIIMSGRLDERGWLSVSSLELIDQRVIRFVREKFQYEKSPILVAMDDQGKVVNPNALHIMIVSPFYWYPYTTMDEKTYWQWIKGSLILYRLMPSWDFSTYYSMGQDEQIIVYGGGDVEWIRNFTTKARQIAEANKIKLEMLYVGKSGKTSEQEKMKTLLDTIEKENLSKFYLGKEFVWFFWVRLQSMLFSKINVQLHDDHDPLMQLVEKLMIYDRIGTWALFGKGQDIGLTARGPEALKTLENFEAWKQDVGTDHLHFHDAFQKQYNQQIIGADHPCCTLDIHDTSRTPKNVLCPECSRSMEQQSIFSCSHD
ncbi:hypothetical protein ACJIZ3_024558 [Penstemon smallii]|uniref:Protein SIEVE ELEMENT OCCLUSION B-like n=1 Tax=Penstemon smallii TaxID=265156 RepID=A0ABD3TT30_9LAMI